ncbi:DUF4352 domain-containing protein [Nocardia sp. NBC_01327]|uniref:DUF4352 domain-containing protein n=1 Tax=Nocardia sp. NBC_01327 TaxID=2903593 RepID=UPI002E10CF8A|nr:DUF4352 domain-containing protein [Nocardia sp. NBC_01327]
MKYVRRCSTALLGALAVSVALTGCGPSTGDAVVTKANSGGPAAAQAAPAKVGDTIGLKGIASGTKADVTVVQVIDAPTSGDDVDALPPGKRYYAVQFRIVNTGTAAYDDAPSNGAKVVDSQGQTFPASLTYADTSAGPNFGTTLTIAPGDNALGFLVFQVPADATIAKVQFGMDSGMSDRTGQWTVA